MARLGPQLQGAVKAHASGNTVLVASATGLAETARLIAEITRPEAVSMTQQDFVRDELGRALVLGVESGTHRVDKPAKMQAAMRLEKGLVEDGCSWMSAPLGEETVRVNRLLTDAATVENAADLTELGLTDVVTALGQAQTDFEATEQKKGGVASSSQAATQKMRKLGRAFHRQLDLFVAQVEHDFEADDSAKAPTRLAIIQPLREATARLRAARTDKKTEDKPVPTPPT
jgi:flagellar hook-basal body complex protein FliE